MKYRINKTNYHSFNLFEDGKLPPRSYFIPYPDKASGDKVSRKDKRYCSPKVLCLNGDWDFCFYKHTGEMPDVMDTDTIDFSAIDVPSCWQFRGYDRPFYVNVRYQFPFNPPEIPTTEKVGRVFSLLGDNNMPSPGIKNPGEEYNHVGVYRTFFETEDINKRFIISFLGVASCLDLYLNGRYIGYSEGSHNTAEFDLSGKVVAGKNELLCVVHRWCNGSYLEDQDMFRNNGIFRDVLLRIDEATGFFDIEAKTEKTGEGYSLSLGARTFSDTNVTFVVETEEGTFEKTVETVGKKARVSFEGLVVKEWTAETPVLYNIYYITDSACIKEKIGFKEVRIEKDVFLLNGRKIKLKGVNHHDSHPKNGYTLTPEDIERDLRLCKEYNINTIRTSHYPPDPYLLEMADELGIYIIDENDLETHGTVAQHIPPSYNIISDNPLWSPHYMDRIKRLYGRDKIRANTSIIMWSLGNEAGGRLNTDFMYEFLKKRSSLPVQYEGVIYTKRMAYDVASRMYPPVSELQDVGKHRDKRAAFNDRPYFMCEYAHAMGVGPGNIEAYWDEILKYDNLMGGCVWEMCDHAVEHEDGSFTYGGDHGEWEHDGNFCVDGLFYPDRKPSVGAKIMKFIYRDIRLSHVEGDVFELFNTTSFTEGSEYELDIRWNDGSGYSLCEEIPPLTKKRITLTPGASVDGLKTLTVTAKRKSDGSVVSCEQLLLENKVPGNPERNPLPNWFSFKGGRAVLDLGDGQNLVASREAATLYRAATDNDRALLMKNTMRLLYNQKTQVVSTERTDFGLRVRYRILSAGGIFFVTETYEGCRDGVLVRSHLKSEGKTDSIPRFAKIFRLESKFDRVTYTGRAGESYCDMKNQFPIEEVSCRVSDMTEPNIRPQESGNRCDCRNVCISDGNKAVEFIAVDAPFELGVKPYSDGELTSMKHREDEKVSGTYVAIQAFQQGIGTGACGPGIQPMYKYSAAEEYDLAFIIKINQD